ncbi:MAG: type IV secretion system DNA-binding domain-containing protein [Pseudomonadota bacterium]
MPEQKAFKSFLRGGQTTIHTFRMATQVLGVMTTALVATLVLVISAWTFVSTESYDRYLAYKYGLAEVMLFLRVKPENVILLRLPDGETRHVAIGDFVVNDAVIEARNEVLNRFSEASVYGAAAGTGLALWIMWFFLNRGSSIAKERHLRGAQETPPDQLKRLIRAENRKREPGIFLKPAPGRYRPYELAGVPYPWRGETLHTLIAGTTGVGKTQFIHSIVEQIRDRGDRAVIFDPMGNYVEAFFDPAKDALLNPLDARCRNWSIFRDAEMSADYDAIAAAMIPMSKQENPVWAEAARTVFSVAAQLLKGDSLEAGDPSIATNDSLIKTLLTSSPTELEDFLEGTVATQIVNTKAERMAAGVRMMLSTYLKALQMMPDEGAPFSISQWINDDRSDAILFLTSRADAQTSLAPLITVWMDIAIKSLLSRQRDQERTVWFVFDELARLHQLPSIKQGMTEGRQFGAASVIGVQARSLLKDVYGHDGAQALNGLCRNKLILSVADFDEAQWYANDIGRREVRRMEEGVSFGASEIRDGVNLSARDKHELIVMPEQLMNLPNLEGYVKMAEGFPVSRVKHRYKKPVVVAPAFVPRSDVADLARRAIRSDGDASKPDAPQDAEQPTRKKKTAKEKLKQAQLKLDGLTPDDPKTPSEDRRPAVDRQFIHEI